MSRPRYLIDTNIVSELMRRKPAPSVVQWAGAQSGFYLSVISLEELLFGLSRKSFPLKSQWLEDFLPRHCQILEITVPIARASGALRGKLAAAGQVRHPSDLLIAATALLHHLPLATRNTSDFADCGIQTLNPFKS